MLRRVLRSPGWRLVRGAPLSVRAQAHILAVVALFLFLEAQSKIVNVHKSLVHGKLLSWV